MLKMKILMGWVCDGKPGASFQKVSNDVHVANPGSTLSSKDSCHATGVFTNACHWPSNS